MSCLGRIAAVGLAAVASVTACSRKNLSAAEVVAKSVEARGGLEAWRKVKTMVWSGYIESSHAPASVVQFTLEQKRPNKTRFEIDAQGEKSLRVFDGVQGWKTRLSRGPTEPMPYAPQEVKSAQTAHVIEGSLIDHAARGNTVSLEGLDEIEGRKVWHLSVHLAKGGTEDVWVDAKTFLEVRYDRMVEGPNGATRRVSTTYDDYRTVEGIKVPFVIQTGGGTDVVPDKMLIDKVTMNIPLDESRFGRPGPGMSQRASPPPASWAPGPSTPAFPPGQARTRPEPAAR